MFLSYSREALSLILLGGGTALAAGSALGASVWRRADVPLSALLWAGSQAAIHPERFIRPGRVGAVRVLGAAGVTLFLLGVVALFLQ